MKRRSVHVGLVLLVACLAAGRAKAVSVRTWSASTAEEFGKGQLEGTAIDEEGRVRLSRELATLWGPEPGIVWSARTSPAGRGAFLALSGPGRLIEVAASGKAETWYRAEGESLVTAVEVLPDGSVWAGVSPEGRLLRLSAAGQVVQTVETGAKFIWALGQAGAGAVWIGTGAPGGLRRVGQGGVCETVFATGDDPVRSLLSLGAGGALVGTGERGRVIRVDADGRALVLLDAEESEIVALQSGPEGSIYALAASGKKQVTRAGAAPNGAEVETVRVVADAPPLPPGVEAGEPDEQAPPEVPKQGFQTSPGAALHRIAPDGASVRIWQESREVPYALLFEAGRLLVGTGDKGRLHVLDTSGREVMLLQVASEQASALAPLTDGGVWIGGTGDARLLRLETSPRQTGSYLSPAVDAVSGADWGRLVWHAETPRGSRLELSARAGHTEEPDETWYEWKTLGGGASGGAQLDLPPARFVQVRADLRPSPSGESPLLRSLELTYRPRNRVPKIESLTVEPAGVVWTRERVTSGQAAGPIVAGDPLAREVRGSLGRRGVQPIRKSFERGARTVSWQANDPDDDRLVGRLEIRREGQDTWFVLANDLVEDYFSWDSRDLADGLYRVRLTAEDSRDNPDGRELADTRTSAVFVVDHTRPSLGTPKFTRAGGRLTVEFEAEDAGGAIHAVELAMDEGAWQPVDPVDGVADAPRELYRVALAPASGPAPRALRVRVADAAGNLGGEIWVIEDR